MLQLPKRLQHGCNDFDGSSRAYDLSVMLMDGIQVAFGFLSQYYARHVLPT